MMPAIAAGAAVANIAGGAALGVAAMAGVHIPATIRCVDPTALGLVYFDLNPDNITMSRGPKGNNKPNAQGGSSPRVLQKSPPPSIRLNKVVLYGEDTKMRVDTLLAWCGPPTGLVTALMGLLGITNSNQPTVWFQWGPPMLGFMYDVKLSQVDATYIRFHSSGIPVRAEVNITMQVEPKSIGSIPTNPTSGGLPGRRTHMVRGNDSLQSIAQQHYGRPGLWRKIAEINGIDNPQRLRPGTTVYLPGPDDLTASSR